MADREGFVLDFNTHRRAAGIVFVAMMVVEKVMAFVGMILTIVVPCLRIFGGLWLFVTICSKD